MASIIDRLLVTLGLDTKDFDKGKVRVDQGLKDSAEKARKRGGEVEDSAKKQGQAFAKLRGELVGLLAAYVSAKAVTQFAMQNIQATAAVGRTSQVLAMGTNTVNAWGDAIKAAGGDANEAAAAFGKISDIRANFVRNPGALNMPLMGQLGIKSKTDFDDEEGLMYKLADQYQRELANAKAKGPGAEKEVAATYRQRLQELLGLSDNWIAMIERGRPALQKEIELYKEKDRVTAEDAEAARQSIQEFEHLAASLNGLFRALGGVTVVKTTADLFDFLASGGLKMNDGMRHVALGFYALTHPLATVAAILAKMGVISADAARAVQGMEGVPQWMLEHDAGPPGALGNPGGTIPTQAGGAGYDAVVGNGKFGSPNGKLSDMTVGQAIQFGAQVLKPKTRAAGIGRDSRGLLGSSAMGAYQITAETLQHMAPGILGRDWQNQKFDAAAQEKIAEAIFNQSKGGNLHNIWANPRISSRPGAYANMSWAQVRGLIMAGEGTGTPAARHNGPPAGHPALNPGRYDAASARLYTRGGAGGGDTHVSVHVDARGASDPHKVATLTGQSVKHAMRKRGRVANSNTGVG